MIAHVNAVCIELHRVRSGRPHAAVAACGRPAGVASEYGAGFISRGRMPREPDTLVVSVEGLLAGLRVHGIVRHIQFGHLRDHVGILRRCHEAVGQILDDSRIGAFGGGDGAAVRLDDVITAFLIGRDIGLKGRTLGIAGGEQLEEPSCTKVVQSPTLRQSASQ